MTAGRAHAQHESWLSRSGFPELHEGNTVATYTRRLCSYISDPSTVRARTLDAFGAAPSIEQIRKVRAEYVETIADRKRRHNTAHLRPHQKERLWQVEAPKPVLKLVPPEPVPTPEPAPKPEPEQRRLPVAARGFLLRTKNDVIDACAAACDITHGELIGSMRGRQYIIARGLCAAVLHARGNSLANVGRMLGGRDHTTIMNSVQKFFVRDLLEPEVAAAWQSLAPCVTKMCRTYEELRALIGVQL